MAALAPGLGLKGVVWLTWDSLRVVVQVFLGVRQVHGLSLQGCRVRVLGIWLSEALGGVVLQVEGVASVPNNGCEDVCQLSGQVLLLPTPGGL